MFSAACTRWIDYGNGTAAFTQKLDSKHPIYNTTYQTAQIANRTLDWLDLLHTDPVKSQKPFFAYLGPRESRSSVGAAAVNTSSLLTAG